jgi:hypothetical protein
LLVVAGPNGAGKTTITERGLAHEWFHDCEYVNPDAIAQDELGDWNDAETVLRAAQLATERREACLREGRSLAFETVFSAVDKPEFVRRALAAGYFVRIFFVGICYTPEDAEASVRAFGGRCEQFVFCSSAVVYGARTPLSVLIGEDSALEPTSHWGKSKLVCEQTLMRACGYPLTAMTPPGSSPMQR